MANTTNDRFSDRADIHNSDLYAKVPMSEGSLESMSHNAGKRLGAMASDIATSTNNYMENGRDYVKENPVKGVAIAAAAGALAGSLFSLVMTKRK